MKLHDERRDYEQGQLRRSQLPANPFELFAEWFKQSQAQANSPDPTAFTLATVGTDGQPHQRIVLLKQVDATGLVFFTNYQSQKGQDLAANPLASMHFAWLNLERQIKIEGRVEKLDTAVSTDYFASRPRGSQLGAHTSAQSQPIANRDQLEARYHQLSAEFEGQEIPKPEHWGGYRVVPSLFEFWQGGRYRLHDRFSYRRSSDTEWHIERLQP
ncbi:MAG: Pyridoxine/pyridoxamine 5'-phosphate oxidase [Pseudidiomarina mangrovi]|nr:MAG: Pyridoxine/pyridoxamine 5'-phosphate oxidase [Pseudidiomarina mangrovi]